MLSKDPGGSPTPDKLRPLGLIETTRKLWTQMILTRIKNAMLKHKVLQANQYGFMPKKGTDSEILQILNLIEEAIEHHEAIDLITWDIRKAFDSVGQNLQYLAWRRLGVPRPIAAWLVQLDNKGSFTVRSPYSLNRIAQVWQGPSAFADTQRVLREDGFEAGQGLTQGDVKSTLSWVAVFDILLTAMNDYKNTCSSATLGMLAPSCTTTWRGPLRTTLSLSLPLVRPVYGLGNLSARH